MKVSLILSSACIIALAMFSHWRFGTQAHVSLIASAAGDSVSQSRTSTGLTLQIAGGVADPTMLPKATGQAPPGTVPNVAGNSYYLDPTSGVKVWRATSATYPCAANNGGSFHDYGDVLQISGDLGGNKHTLLIRTCGEYKLVDFERGKGFSNWRSLASDSYPAHDLSFTFSYKKDMPHIAYVTTAGGRLVRYNTITNIAEPIGNFPKSWTGEFWLQNDKYDRWFVATTAANGGCVAFDSATNLTMTQTIPNFDECHLENNGRYVDLSTGAGGDYVWDLQTNAVTPFNPPLPGHLFHLPSPSGFFVAVDVNSGGGKYPFYRMNPVDGSSSLINTFGGYGTSFHQSGSWLQEGTPETRQWVMYSAFGNHNPSYAPSPGYIYKASGFYRLDGSDFRFLAHTFHDWNGTYFEIPFTTCAADGKICMFNSNMNGRGDVYVAEVPLSGDSPAPIPTPIPTPTPKLTPTPTPIPTPSATTTISNVRASSITSSSAIITWTASRPCDSQVEYGRSSAYGGMTTLNPTLVIDHAAPLTGLTANTLYHFRARSRDAAGNLNISVDFTFTTLSASGGGGAQAIIWTNIVNATLTGTTLRKTAGCDGCASTAVSGQTIRSGNGYVEFTVSEMTKLRSVGLTRSDKADPALNMDYAISLGAYGVLEIRERGSYRMDMRYQTGDVLRIAIENGVVMYYRNGARIYQSLIATGYPVAAAALLLNLDATVANAMIVAAPTINPRATKRISSPRSVEPRY